MKLELIRLADLAGIEPTFRDFWGNTVVVSEETVTSLLLAMGFAVGPDDDVAATLQAALDAPWRRVFDAVAVIHANEGPIALSCTLPADAGERASWRITLENGDELTGSLRTADIATFDERELDGRLLTRRTLSLPILVPPGYHRAELQIDDLVAQLSLIAVPVTCHQPAELRDRRVWGVAAQVYTLRSAGNWGIGDFSDLAELARISRQRGAEAVGVNPLHLLHATNPLASSPYGPSSRLFLNPLYIDPTAVVDFAESRDVRNHLRSNATSEELAKLRDQSLVDYEGVATLKYAIFEKMYDSFRRNHLDLPTVDERADAFRAFRARGGSALERVALYDALAEHFRRQDPEAYGWQRWPAEYRSPDSTEVRTFASEARERVEYYIYLQWIAEQQLESVKEACAGMAVGLYRDLAVGADAGGADAWSEQRVVLEGASIGAPPDPLAPQGQDWGLPPLSPYGLRESGYASYIALLRSNMKHAGALRIDHVMALTREFWIPRSRPPSEGAYVKYPFEEMLGILALESARQQCIVIGEDLGTVPEGFRERLQTAGVLSYRLLYFERNWDTSFKLPGEYPQLALASTGTHDLPPLAGWWTGHDIAERLRLGIIDDAIAGNMAEERQRSRYSLVDALERAGAVDGDLAHQLRVDAERGGTAQLIEPLIMASYQFLGSSPAMFLLVQIEDITCGFEQVNIPGTVGSHNWSRKLNASLAELSGDERFDRIAGRLARGIAV